MTQGGFANGIPVKGGILQQPTTLLGVLKVPAALDVLAPVVRVLGTARAEDLLAGLVVRLAAFFVR